MNEKIGVKVDKTNKAIDNLISYANNKRDKITKDIIDAVLLVIIFALFGCFDFVSWKVHFEYLLSIEYWTRTISKAVAGVCAWHIGVNFAWDREIARDEVLEENAKKYKTLQKLKDQITFNDYIINVFNPKEKKRAYLDQINKRIYKLNKHAKNRDKLLYGEMKDIPLNQITNRYCIRRKELELMKDEEFIKNNLDSIDVRYNFVDPILFELELDGGKAYHGYKIKGNVALGKTKKTASIFSTMVLVSAVLTSLGLGANQQAFEDQMQRFWTYLMTCCMDFGIIAWQVLKGTLASKKIISQEITTPLVNRNRILTSYIEYCVENKIDNSKSFMIFEKLESEIKNETMA